MRVRIRISLLPARWTVPKGYQSYEADGRRPDPERGSDHPRRHDVLLLRAERRRAGDARGRVLLRRRPAPLGVAAARRRRAAARDHVLPRRVLLGPRLPRAGAGRCRVLGPSRSLRQRRSHEDIVVSNLEHRERRLTLELRFEADFADILEARDGDATASPTRHRSSFGRSSKPQRASAIGCRRSSPDSPATRRTSPSAIRPLSFRRRGPRRGRSSACGRSSVSTWPTASCEPSPSAAA
jgi:glycogen debranching enzyme-like protein